MYPEIRYLYLMTVNQRIRQARQSLNMTQADFSKAIYVSSGYTAGIENGHRVANDRIIHLIGLTFGVSEQWLKTGEGGMFQTSPLDRKERIIALFNELNPRFQEYALAVIDQLLKLQNGDTGTEPESE
jgi:transcriptional regulator with XRE-family HTH domain